MQHLPGDHAAHDTGLIAAYAAGDTSAGELARAEALLAGCAACAELVTDLRAVRAEMARLPAPARPRDFRLTGAQAARLRPRGLRGLLTALGGPRFAFATPLGTGLVALGIVGVLVASGGTSMGARSGSSAEDQVALQYAAPEASAVAGLPAPSPAPVGAGGGPGDTLPTADLADGGLLVPSALLILTGTVIVLGRAGSRRLG